MRTIIAQLSFLSVLVVSLIQPVLAQEQKATATTKAGICDHLFIIGASVSAGFIAEEPLGGKKTPQYALKHYCACALNDEPKRVDSAAETFLFMHVAEGAPKQIEQAIAANPSLVIGVDFLFWHCYGQVAKEEDRLALLNKGLALLEKIPGKAIVGDIPNAAAAAGGMLAVQQIPKPETIAAANVKIRDWAKQHPACIILPVSEFMATCIENRPLQLGPVSWPQGKTRALLQADKLHVARHGCAALALSVMQTLVDQKLLPADKVRADVAEIYTKALARVSQP